MKKEFASVKTNLMDCFWSMRNY